MSFSQCYGPTPLSYHEYHGCFQLGPVGFFLWDNWVVDLLPGWVGMKIDPVEPTTAYQQ